MAPLMTPEPDVAAILWLLGEFAHLVLRIFAPDLRICKLRKKTTLMSLGTTMKLPRGLHLQRTGEPLSTPDRAFGPLTDELFHRG